MEINIKRCVAIVGRVNVGKSTLFNRLVGTRLAITQEEPGVTRDRLYGETNWRGAALTFIDTGGVQGSQDVPLLTGVLKQTKAAINEADLVLFLVDQKEGMTCEDKEVALLLHSSGKPVLLAANKADHAKGSNNFYDLYELGFGEPVLVSALHGTGTGDLLDEIVNYLEEVKPLSSLAASSLEKEIKVAIVGRPNVGKSSIVNSILGEERVLVDDVPGTTRDAIDTHFVFNGVKFNLVDTAGLRKKAKVRDSIEFYSTVRAVDAIARSEVAALILDAGDMNSSVVHQDKVVAQAIQDAGRSSVIVINKSDLLPKNKKGKVNEEAKNNMANEVYYKLQFMGYAPICFTSAIKKEGLRDLLETITQVHSEFYKQIDTSVLNKGIREFLFYRPPSPHNKGVLKIFYATQVKAGPPTFLLFVNDPRYLSSSYRRYLMNRMRGIFGFTGTPIHFLLKKRSKVDLPA